MAENKYSGVLNEPLLLQPKVSVLGGELEATESFITGMKERIDALYEHYGIDQGGKGADFSLAFELAKVHVPGFKVVSKISTAGRPGSWKGIRGFELFAEVKKRTNIGMSLNKAAEEIADQGIFKKENGEKYEWKTIKTRYGEILKPDALFGKMRKSFIEKGFPEDIFDKYVISEFEA